MDELLIELFSEEIPARMQQNAANDFKRLFTAKLESEKISYSTISSFCAMRRLVLIVDDLPEILPDSKIEKKGPKIDANISAIEGFCKSVGKELADLEIREINKIKFYFAVEHQKAVETASVLIKILNEILVNFPWPKSMKWGDHQINWIRPLKNILAIFAGSVLPCSYGHLKANNLSFGHRFLVGGSFEVKNSADYFLKLKEHLVILDATEGKTLIKNQIAELLKDYDISLAEDEQLLNEVVGLVEYPYSMMGRIEERFTSLPQEVIITAMKTHQKYFSTYNKADNLAPYFVLVANIRGEGDEIIAGNEKVLRARLKDAEFFYEQDLKKGLHQYSLELGKVVYHHLLGTMLDKTNRIIKLSNYIAKILVIDEVMVSQAARLCKADLVCSMVSEFPELQGVMGGYYASKAGFNPQVANAIKTHYKPLGPQDSCPTEMVAIAISLADKIDNIAGLFMIGEKPSGSKDPFALRRAALGAIRIILENNLTIKLKPLFSCALQNYGNIAEKQIEEIIDFFADRFKYLLKSSNISISVDVAQDDDLLASRARIYAIDDLYQSEDAIPIVNNFKRVINIVAQEAQKISTNFTNEIIIDLFQEEAERALYQTWLNILPKVEAEILRGNFTAAIEFLKELSLPIEQFFEVVVVNCDDLKLKNNRFALLTNIGALLQKITNFGTIEG